MMHLARANKKLLFVNYYESHLVTNPQKKYFYSSLENYLLHENPSQKIILLYYKYFIFGMTPSLTLKDYYFESTCKIQ